MVRWNARKAATVSNKSLHAYHWTFGHGCMMTKMKAASVSNTHIKCPEPYKDYFGHSSTECVILIGYYAVCWVLMLYNVGVAYL